MKKWHTPELIVLVRGTPEESVLVPCKSNLKDVGLAGASSPSASFATCSALPFAPGLDSTCGSCDTISSS